MLSNLRPSLVLLGTFTLLTGIAYPLAMTGVAQALFPAQAGGSLVTREGATIGSGLIGQSFTSERYFHGRPSAVGYDASTSSGSNLGPSSKTLADDIAQRAAAYGGGPLPADLVTASGSGLDPDLSPEAAAVQVARVAAARKLPVATVEALVRAHVQGPDLGILGEARVNVLALNLALDALQPD
jgi:potassium-transporting ATPase KdpC subunit